jgi:hypothetical protein
MGRLLERVARVFVRPEAHVDDVGPVVVARVDGCLEPLDDRRLVAGAVGTEHLVRREAGTRCDAG